jgi:branched-chain amino acid transport system substrate-binding protein
MAASSIYQRAKVVQFGFTNSHPDFTKGGDFMFSPGVSQEIGATKLAEHTVQTQGKKLAVLYLNTDWGKVTSQIFVDKAKALGANIVASEAYLSDEKDFRPILSKVRDTNPEVLVLISYYADGSLILKQAESTGLKAKVIAAGSTYSPQFISLGGSAVEGVVIPTNFFPDSPRPEIQTFVNLWRKRYNEEPNSFAIGAYDALKILAWAADKGNLDRVGIQQALLTGKNIPSILLGPFSFAEDRRPAGDYVDELIAVKDGKFVHYDNKNP